MQQSINNSPKIIPEDVKRQLGESNETIIRLLPSIHLTEWQSDKFIWSEIHSSISLDVFIHETNSKFESQYPFALVPVRSSQNMMLVHMMPDGSSSGLYMPIEAGNEIIRVRYEWSINFTQNEHREGCAINIIHYVDVMPQDSSQIGSLISTVYSAPASTDVSLLQRYADTLGYQVEATNNEIIISDFQVAAA